MTPITLEWWHFALLIVPILPSLWSIWHIWSHDFNDDAQRKVLWLILTVFIPVIGGIIYIIAGRRHAGARVARHS